MTSAEEFIKNCQSIVKAYNAGKYSLTVAASKINNNVFGYPFKGPAHPMVYKVADCAFDIAEDYRTENEDIEDWATLTRTLENYISGKWEPTCWILSAMYGEYTKGKLTHSYSVAVRRQNGKTLTETASDKLHNAIKKTLNKLNKHQTDQRFLQNLAKLMPQAIDKYTLNNIFVKEYLTDPYYSTNM